MSDVARCAVCRGYLLTDGTCPVRCRGCATPDQPTLSAPVDEAMRLARELRTLAGLTDPLMVGGRDARLLRSAAQALEAFARLKGEEIK